MVSNIKPIKCTWTKETGDWEGNKGYVNRKECAEEKMIEIGTDEYDGKPIIRFIGAPTGHESYYVHMLKENTRLMKGDTMCICAGTINSWARCEVSWTDVLNYMKEQGLW